MARHVAAKEDNWLPFLPSAPSSDISYHFLALSQVLPLAPVELTFPTWAWSLVPARDVKIYSTRRHSPVKEGCICV